MKGNKSNQIKNKKKQNRKPYTRQPGSNKPGNPNPKETAGAKPRYTTAEEIQKKCDLYFAQMKKEKRSLTITGLALALGLNTRLALLNYEDDEKHLTHIELEEKKLIVNTIKRAKLKIEQYAEDNLFTGKQIAGTIFNLKNNFGWIDRTDIKHGGDLIINVHGLKEL